MWLLKKGMEYIAIAREEVITKLRRPIPKDLFWIAEIKINPEKRSIPVRPMDKIE